MNTPPNDKSSLVDGTPDTPTGDGSASSSTSTTTEEKEKRRLLKGKDKIKDGDGSPPVTGETPTTSTPKEKGKGEDEESSSAEGGRRSDDADFVFNKKLEEGYALMQQNMGKGKKRVWSERDLEWGLGGTPGQSSSRGNIVPGNGSGSSPSPPLQTTAGDDLYNGCITIATTVVATLGGAAATVGFSASAASVDNTDAQREQYNSAAILIGTATAAGCLTGAISGLKMIITAGIKYFSG